MSTHADFEMAPQDLQFIGALEQLRQELEIEARKTPGKWVSRVLPKGAWVGMCLRGDGRLELGLHRNTMPKSEVKMDAWRHEIRTFLHYFDCELWRSVDPPKLKYGVSAHFLEVKPPPPPLELEL